MCTSLVAFCGGIRYAPKYHLCSVLFHLAVVHRGLWTADNNRSWVLRFPAQDRRPGPVKVIAVGGLLAMVVFCAVSDRDEQHRAADPGSCD